MSPSGELAIHAFLHVHGEHFQWPEDPWNLPEREPGELLWNNTTLRQGGNHVRSYLDVIAPDRVTARELETALTALWADLMSDEVAQRDPKDARLRGPRVFRHGQVVLRFGVELALEDGRALEMAQLREAVGPATARWDVGNLAIFRTG